MFDYEDNSPLTDEELDYLKQYAGYDTMDEASKVKWIQKAIKNPGALRKTLKVKKGKKITAKQINKAIKSKNPKTRRRAILAKTLMKLSKKKKKKKKKKK